MNSVEKLIQELCPDGVKFVKLGDVADVGTGSSNGNEATEDGEYPFFVRSQIIKKKDDYEYDEEAIIIPGEGGIGEIFHYVNGKYALHQRVYRIHFTTSSISAKFAYYYTQNSFKAFIMKKAVSATVSSIRKPMIEGFELPLPPLAIQSRIVEILDNFSSLTAELQAELQARRSQYDYYRNHLLSFDGYENIQNENNTTTNNSSAAQGKTVKWVKLGDVCEIIRGKRFVRDDIREEGVPCIHYGDLYTHYGHKANKTKCFLNPEIAPNMRYAEKNDVIVVQAGENRMDLGVGVAWLGDESVAVHNACFILRHKQEPRYISHFLRTHDYHWYIQKYASEGKIASFSAKVLANAIIPLPSLSEQRRIADILDRFEALTTDLQCGLPAEIQARQQQYEYYRNKLLTFERCAQ